LVWIRCVYAALEDAAAMAVSGNVSEIRANLVIDELVISAGEREQAFLDDVVSIDVLRQFQDVVV
jgi:hypothetical protein